MVCHRSNVQGFVTNGLSEYSESCVNFEYFDKFHGRCAQALHARDLEHGG